MAIANNYPYKEPKLVFKPVCCLILMGLLIESEMIKDLLSVNALKYFEGLLWSYFRNAIGLYVIFGLCLEKGVFYRILESNPLKKSSKELHFVGHIINNYCFLLISPALIILNIPTQRIKFC